MHHPYQHAFQPPQLGPPPPLPHFDLPGGNHLPPHINNPEPQVALHPPLPPPNYPHHLPPGYDQQYLDPYWNGLPPYMPPQQPSLPTVDPPEGAHNPRQRTRRRVHFRQESYPSSNRLAPTSENTHSPSQQRGLRHPDHFHRGYRRPDQRLQAPSELDRQNESFQRDWPQPRRTRLNQPHSALSTRARGTPQEPEQEHSNPPASQDQQTLSLQGAWQSGPPRPASPPNPPCPPPDAVAPPQIHPAESSPANIDSQ